MIDSHCHIGIGRLKEETPAMIERAFASGVTNILSVACKPEELSDLIALLDTYHFIYGAFGIHPEYANEEEISPEKLIQGLLAHPRLVGVGETGLDYYYQPETRAAQLKAFQTHIEVAYRLKKPIIIHTRSAEADTSALLKEADRAGYLAYGGVLHCFTGSSDLAETALSLGLHISASGVITFKNAADLRRIFEIVPLNRLLVETDAPYLAPVPYRGQTNEPAFVAETLKMLAAIHRISPQEADTYTTSNFKKLFKIKGLS